jgi:pyridoxamine 5'-phosphate oxidase
MSLNIAGIRQEYKQQTLLESTAATNPFSQFEKWWQEALASEISEINAMTLATSTADGVPSARTVLLKGYDSRGFVFFTNYESQKGVELAENPRACLLFFWKELERQIRITGLTEKISAEESDAYFQSRPAGSRIGAHSSPQSRVIENRDWLEKEEKKNEALFADGDIPRPVHWGGYRVKPVNFEFWQGRPSRLHDRLFYTLEENGLWKIERLAP